MPKKESKKTKAADYDYLGLPKTDLDEEYAAGTDVQPENKDAETKAKPKGHC